MGSLLKRGTTWYAQYYQGGIRRRVSLETDSCQVAKEKLRRLESSLVRGEGNPLPTRSPIGEVVAAYVRHIRTVKTAKSAQTDIYYLREAFGPVCDELKVTSRRVGKVVRKQSRVDGRSRRDERPIEAKAFEQVTTAQIADFIAGKVRTRGLAPKTANRYREILHRLFNWAIDEGRVRLHADRNPVGKVSRYKERAPEIRFLTLPQIQEQLETLRAERLLLPMVATLIYAGLRREELVWLTRDDLDFRSGPHGLIRIRAKTVRGEAWQPKTKVNRAVPISEKLRGILDRYGTPLVGEEWMFPSPKGCRWDPDNFSRSLRDANCANKLPWGCLDFRHTFGSHLAMKGESLFKIATLMGNSPDICRRHYAALSPESLIESVEF